MERGWSTRFAAFAVHSRYALIGGWIAAAIVALATLPAAPTPGTAGLRGLVPDDSAAVEAEIRDLRAFGFPVLSRTIVVQHEPGGLSVPAQARVVLRAVNLTRGLYPGLDRIAGALPITNAFGIVEPERATGDTALTLLFFRPDVGVADRERLAKRFVDERLDPKLDSPAGITGAVPGRLQQGRLLKSRLPIIESMTVGLILLIVGVHFRSIGAPLVALTAAGVSYVVSLNVITRVLASAGLGLPEELEPLIVVLLLGIVTDYSIFFLEHAREGFTRSSDAARDVARSTFEHIAPIVATAGLAIAIGTVALVVARLDTFRALGPGMALTVLVGMAVSITLVPATIAVAGKTLFWPSIRRSSSRRRSTDAPGWLRAITHGRKAAVTAAVGVVALGAAAAGMTSTSLGFSIVGALPPDDPARRAAAAAANGFAEGIVSPTTMLVESRDGTPLTVDRLVAVQRALERRPGVAGVVGPADVANVAGLADQLPVEAVTTVPEDLGRSILRTVVTGDRSAARMIIVLDEPPLAGPAIDIYRSIRADMPLVLQAAGIDPRSVRIGFAGDTAVGAETIDQTVGDLIRILIAVAIAMTVLLAIYLRALLAPLLLVVVSLLAFGAALGLTAVASRLVGWASMSFFVPFASAVLLVSLGSDYNIFLVGQIWARARTRPLRDAILEVAPDASRAITVAGITLAASFAILAIVPLRPMQQFAFAMSIGIVVDTFVVRSVIVPALLAAIGPVGGWPGQVGRRRREEVSGTSSEGTTQVSRDTTG